MKVFYGLLWLVMFLFAVPVARAQAGPSPTIREVLFWAAVDSVGMILTMRATISLMRIAGQKEEAARAEKEKRRPSE